MNAPLPRAAGAGGRLVPARQSLPPAHSRQAGGEEIALYVHWPFCVSKCPYCDFNSHVRSQIDQGQWREALLADLDHEARLLPGRRLTSIFFGGGTPSLMEPATVEALIEAARSRWNPAEDLEITLEANPNSVEAARFADLAAAGVNRLSLGLQSFDDRALAFLGRAHGAAEGMEALDIAQRHFGRVSFDLIYALPGDSEPSWSESLDRALGLGTTHLSLYQLTIEPGTRFSALAAAGKLVRLEAEAAAALYELTAERTAAAGLPAYEISNHSAPGAESRHNLTYWRYGDYAGIGPGAHGRRCGLRTVRHRKPENFLSALQRRGSAIAEQQRLEPREAADEALVMGLRLTEGIELAALERRFRLPIVDPAAVERLTASGHVEQSAGKLRATASGRLVLDYLLGELAAA